MPSRTFENDIAKSERFMSLYRSCRRCGVQMPGYHREPCNPSEPFPSDGPTDDEIRQDFLDTM
jgi:hypothetical protein